MCVPNPPVSRAPPAFSVRLREALAENHRRVTASFSALSGGARVTASEPHCRITPCSPPPNQSLQPAVKGGALLPPRPYPSADSPPLPRRSLWIVGEENRCMSALPSARAAGPAPPPPRSWQWARRGRALAAAASVARDSLAPRTIARAWGAGIGKGEEGICLLPCSCLIMVYFLPECLL